MQSYLTNNTFLTLHLLYNMYMNFFAILLPLIQIRIVILDPVFELNCNSGVILNSFLNCAQACWQRLYLHVCDKTEKLLKLILVHPFSTGK